MSDPSTTAVRPPTSSMPTASFLHARLDTLRESLLIHFRNALAMSQANAKVLDLKRDPDSNRVVEQVVQDDSKTPDLAQTRMDGVRLDVEVEGMVKACEDLMLFGRMLKEGWVFGGLDTLKKEGDEERVGNLEEWRKAREGMEAWLRDYVETMDGKDGKQVAEGEG